MEWEWTRSNPDLKLGPDPLLRTVTGYDLNTDLVPL